MGKGKPKPFQRQSVDLGSASVRRSWKTILFTDLRVDDIAVDVGRVTGYEVVGNQTKHTFLSGLVVFTEILPDDDVTTPRALITAFVPSKQ